MRNRLPTSRRWARVAKPGQHRSANAKELAQLQYDLTVALRRMAEHGYRTTPSRVAVTRIALTRLQREMREATEENPDVAADNIIQGVRKYLHLFLDH